MTLNQIVPGIIHFLMAKKICIQNIILVKIKQFTK